MKIIAFLGIIGLSCLLACQSGDQGQEQSNDSLSQSNDVPAPDQEQKYCFLRTEGTQQQDSSFLHLVIRGESVNGTYNAIPYEKDSRRGTLLGKVDGQILDLVWTFTQEGMQDTLRVVFKWQDDNLLRKPFSVNTLNGRQVTLDSSDFSETYEQIDCTLIP